MVEWKKKQQKNREEKSIIRSLKLFFVRYKKNEEKIRTKAALLTAHNLNFYLPKLKNLFRSKQWMDPNQPIL